MASKSGDAQREMTFSKRGEDLTNIRRSRVGDAYAKLMLRTIDDRIGEGHSWDMTFADLADEMEVSIDIAYRRAHYLADRGLLSFTLVNASAARYRFVIGRSNLPDFIPEPSDRRRIRRRGRPRGTGRSGRAKTIANSENISLIAKTFRSQRKHFANSDSDFFTSAPLAPTTAPSASKDGWGEAEARLISYGVASYEGPIQTARERGLTPEDVIAIVEHAESLPGAWGPGAVRRRVLTALPGQEASAGWMETSGDFKRSQATPKRSAEVAAEDPAIAHERWLRQRQAKGMPTELTGTRWRESVAR